MFANAKEAIAYGLRVSKFLFHRYLDDLKPDQFEHQPVEGANSIAWIVGHLTLTDRRTLIGLGATDLPALPAGFEERFSATRTKAGAQRGYGDPRELVALFDAHRDRLIATVLAADDAKLREPPGFQNPVFADRGEGALFMGLHTSMHLGQITIIRRSLGYPPIT